MSEFYSFHEICFINRSSCLKVFYLQNDTIMCNFFHTGSYNFINSYQYLYSSEVPKQCEICQKAINGETSEPVHCQKCQREIEAESKQTEDESQDQTSVIGQLSQQPNQSQQGSVIALQDQMGRKVVVVGNTMTMTNQKIQALPHVPSTVIQVISGPSSDTFLLYRGTQLLDSVCSPSFLFPCAINFV